MNYAVILSGGIGSRMNRPECPKQYIEVLGKPVLVYTLEIFQANPDVEGIIIVAAPQWRGDIDGWLREYGIEKFMGYADPGESRQESFLSGLEACMETSKDPADRVIIHEAVRPLVTGKLISACLKEIDSYEGCMPVIPMNDTIYQSTDGQNLTGLADRSILYCGQSPEAFLLWKFTEINRETDRAQLKKIRGASELAYMKGVRMHLIPGEQNNFKITYEPDLDRFQRILESRS